MSKKRRLSPTHSSRSSPTPGPAALPLHSSSLSTIPRASSPASQYESPSLPGPSRLTPAPVAVVRQTAAKPATIVAGSGDGSMCGDECYTWTDLPMNKQGFRYAPCTPSPNPSPNPIYPFYRTIPPPAPSPPVHISWLDRSSYLRLSANALTATSDRGFRSARSNISVRQGSWYFEVQILRGVGESGAGQGSVLGMGESGNAHVRVGWGRREANIDGPVGMDGYGYAIRDVGGEKVHISRPKPYGRGFKTGDVVGCLIHLPRRKEEEIVRRRVPIRYKGQYYFEMDEYAAQKEMEALINREGKVIEEVKEEKPKPGKGATTKNAKKTKTKDAIPSGPVIRKLPVLEDSRIVFYLNGEPLGTAFEGLYDFTRLPVVTTTTSTKKSSNDPSKELLHDDGGLGYYPMISCFGKGKVSVNFGPDWLHPPEDMEARPMYERWDEWREEERLLDERDEARDYVKIVEEMKKEETRKKDAVEKASKGPGGLAGRGGKGTRGKKRKSVGSDRGTATPGPGRSVSTPGPGGMGTPVSRGSETPAPEISGVMESRGGTPALDDAAGDGEELTQGILSRLAGEADAEGEDDEGGVVWG